MSERASDEHLRLLEQALERIENDYKPTCESMSYGNGCPGATDESIDFWRRAVDCVPSMLAELRERRAADPSVRLICQLARDVLIERPPLVDPQTEEQLHSNAVHELLRRAVICVDKLLARKP